MKRILGFLSLVLVLTLCLPAAVSAETLPLVADHGDLLTAEEEESLTAFLAGVSEDTDADIVVLTVDSLEGQNAQAYADDYFDYSGYGRGAEYDGALFLVAMEERQWAVSTSGYGITALHEAGLDYIEETVVPYLSDSAYYAAFLTFGDIVRNYWREEPGGIPNGYEPSHLDNVYSDIYITEEYNKEPVIMVRSFGAEWIFIALIVGFLIALIPMGVLKSQLNTVHMQTGAVPYQKNDGVRITDSRDLYLYRNMTKKPIPRNDPPKSGGPRPGGSIHIGSSGRPHGGRSGGF